jgi:hypothetical protein
MAQLERRVTAVEHSKVLGTYQAEDRSKQYTRADNAELLRAVNEAWNKIRNCEKFLNKKDLEIADLRKRLKHYRVAYTILVSIITGLAWEGLKALTPIAIQLFR